MDVDEKTLTRTAIGVGVLAIAVMLLVGYRPLTNISDLSSAGGYNGLIAYTDSGTLRDRCVRTVDLATGDQVTDEYCSQYLYLHDFDSEGVVVDGDEGAMRLPLDGRDPVPTTIDFTDEEPPRPVYPGPDEEPTLVIDGVTVIELSGPGDYGIDRVLTSPDDSLVLLVDSAQRLIITRTDGTGTPMLIAENVDDVRWQADR